MKLASDTYMAWKGPFAQVGKLYLMIDTNRRIITSLELTITTYTHRGSISSIFIFQAKLPLNYFGLSTTNI